jgi:hypothetical protein
MRDTGLLTGPPGSTQPGRALDRQATAAEPQAQPGEQPAVLRNLRPDAVAVNSQDYSHLGTLPPVQWHRPRTGCGVDEPAGPVGDDPEESRPPEAI